MTDLMEYCGTWTNAERYYKGYNFDTLDGMFVEERNKPSVSVLWFTEVKPCVFVCAHVYVHFVCIICIQTLKNRFYMPAISTGVVKILANILFRRKNLKFVLFLLMYQGIYFFLLVL